MIDCACSVHPARCQPSEEIGPQTAHCSVCVPPESHMHRVPFSTQYNYQRLPLPTSYCTAHAPPEPRCPVLCTVRDGEEGAASTSALQAAQPGVHASSGRGRTGSLTCLPVALKEGTFAAFDRGMPNINLHIFLFAYASCTVHSTMLKFLVSRGLLSMALHFPSTRPHPSHVFLHPGRPCRSRLLSFAHPSGSSCSLLSSSRLSALDLYGPGTQVIGSLLGPGLALLGRSGDRLT